MVMRKEWKRWENIGMRKYKRKDAIRLCVYCTSTIQTRNTVAKSILLQDEREKKPTRRRKRAQK